MKVNILTIFPQAFSALKIGILGRSLGTKWQLNIVDLKKNKTIIDGRPAGGGPGMVLRPDIIPKSHKNIYFLSPDGPVFNHKVAKKMSKLTEITLVCGRYEGVDQRAQNFYKMKKISLGDFILAGGEVAAMVIVEAIIRLLPNIMRNPLSIEEESFSNGLLEHDHYTFPRSWNNLSTPKILLSGHKQNIDNWKFENSLKKTIKIRPDLAKKFFKEFIILILLLSFCKKRFFKKYLSF